MDERTNQIVQDNIGLAKYITKRLINDQKEFEDTYMLAVIGLIKAAITYDECRKFKFATYATKCISNEILMEKRKMNKNINLYSLDKPIDSQDENGMVLGDLIEDKHINIEQEILINEEIEKTMDIIINHLTSRERFIFLEYLAGTKQYMIGEFLDTPKNCICRSIAKCKKKIETKMSAENYKRNNGKYHIRVYDQKIFISFSGTKDDIERKLYKIDFRDYIPSVDINFDNDIVCLSVAVEADSMTYIAKLLYEIDGVQKHRKRIKKI